MPRISWFSFVVLLVFGILASALAVAGDGTVVDVGGVVDVLLELLVSALLAVGTWVLTRIVRRLRLDEDGTVREYLDDAMHRGIEWGVGRVRARGEPLTIHLRNEIVADAVEYLVERVPDALRHFGLDREAIGKMVAARLPELPATPTAP